MLMRLPRGPFHLCQFPTNLITESKPLLNKIFLSNNPNNNVNKQQQQQILESGDLQTSTSSTTSTTSTNSMIIDSNNNNNNNISININNNNNLNNNNNDKKNSVTTDPNFRNVYLCVENVCVQETHVNVVEKQQVYLKARDPVTGLLLIPFKLQKVTGSKKKDGSVDTSKQVAGTSKDKTSDQAADEKAKKMSGEPLYMKLCAKFGVDELPSTRGLRLPSELDTGRILVYLTARTEQFEDPSILRMIQIRGSDANKPQEDVTPVLFHVDHVKLSKANDPEKPQTKKRGKDKVNATKAKPSNQDSNERNHECLVITSSKTGAIELTLMPWIPMSPVVTVAGTTSTPVCILKCCKDTKDKTVYQESSNTDQSSPLLSASQLSLGNNSNANSPVSTTPSTDNIEVRQQPYISAKWLAGVVRVALVPTKLLNSKHQFNIVYQRERDLDVGRPLELIKFDTNHPNLMRWERIHCQGHQTIKYQHDQMTMLQDELETVKAAQIESNQRLEELTRRVAFLEENAIPEKRRRQSTTFPSPIVDSMAAVPNLQTTTTFTHHPPGGGALGVQVSPSAWSNSNSGGINNQWTGVSSPILPPPFNYASPNSYQQHVPGHMTHPQDRQQQGQGQYYQATPYPYQPHSNQGAVGMADCQPHPQQQTHPDMVVYHSDQGADMTGQPRSGQEGIGPSNNIYQPHGYS
ncbi:hypothetical protein SAMD00019534_018660 [Acytostelium subglobosum LB1]|uniref:hypothetical protein n=1 Tax=Acytostelium subglobosum LB1 TaxID=1410327 RepID=UPI000644A7D4|nr:hypothetical protein SAMD00019534_018660 [Acytostelium subglobosum LB1]GAM18691.1 hypothetical protein SAMD00019534_018660 [Acytostelium subglobosum LB1]|eukprot:XP_012757911.1 hypothetical protein SAMD00019534_018660 [Acytostelium subglobosum LB1]